MSRAWLARTVVVLGLVLSLPWPNSAAFWDAAAASRFFDTQARAAYEHGDYALALNYFVLAHDAAPAASSAFNVATVAELAGKPALAYSFLETYLALAPASDANRPAAVAATARLESQLALVEVVTIPPGADVYVDQREHGRYATTPRAVAVEPGSRNIMVTLAGHQDANATVFARRGERIRVELTLTELRSALRVVGAPPGAEVDVERDGVTLAHFAATESAEVPAGALHLVVRCAGFATVERDVRVARTATREVRVDMQPLPPVTGLLLVATGDLPARVRVDGVDRTETPATLRLPVGMHRLELHVDGYEPVETAVEIRENESTLIERQLVRTRNPR